MSWFYLQILRVGRFSGYGESEGETKELLDVRLDYEHGRRGFG